MPGTKAEPRPFFDRPNDVIGDVVGLVTYVRVEMVFFNTWGKCMNVPMDRTRLVTAGELARNIEDHIDAAVAGTPVVVLGDSEDTPVAALVAADDLAYLRRAAEPAPVIRRADYAAVLAATPPGHTPIGVHLDQSPATVPIRGHHLIVARDGFGADQLLVSAITGAALRYPQSELDFVIATAAPVPALPARLLEAAHIVSCQPDLRDATLLARFIEHLTAEVRARRDALRRLHVRSVDDLRRSDPDWARRAPELADLVVVIDRVGELLDLKGELNRLVTELIVAEGSLGLHLWMINPTPLTTVMFNSMPINSILMDVITSRIALQTFSPKHSKTTVGIPDAAFISEPGVGFHKPDNLHVAERFAVTVIAASELDALADAMAPRVGHHMFNDERTRPRWADALPESISLTDTIVQWEAAGGSRNAASVPIGLLDNTGRHELSPFAVTFNEALRALLIVGGNREYLTAAAEAIVVAASATNDREVLQFIYIGPALNTVDDPLWSMPNVDIIDFNDLTKISTAMEKLKHRIDLPLESGHIVLIIDGWDRWQYLRWTANEAGVGLILSPAELVVEMARRGSASGVHVVITSATSYNTNLLEGVTDERIELRMSQAYESKIDQAAAAVIPDDHRHGLTRHGRLLIIDV